MHGFYFIIWQMLSHLMFSDHCIDRCYCQSDCGRFYSHILLADVIAITMWDGVTTHNLILYYDVNYLADVIASYFVVVDVKTTFWTSIYNV